MNKSAQPDEYVDWSQATPGVDYLCFDLYMRMRNPRKIFITETSALTPLAVCSPGIMKPIKAVTRAHTVIFQRIV